MFTIGGGNGFRREGLAPFISFSRVMLSTSRGRVVVFDWLLWRRKKDPLRPIREPVSVGPAAFSGILCPGLLS